MSVEFKAAADCHWFGTHYDAGDTIDTAGYTAAQIAKLMKSAPVYVSEGSGAPVVNWCAININAAFPTKTLTAAHKRDKWSAADLTIDAQSGDDFSIVDNRGFATVVSAGGGRFQASLFLGCPSAPALDSGSTDQRYLYWGATVAPMSDDPDNVPARAVGSLGIVDFVPVIAGGGGGIARNPMSSIAYCSPGKFLLETGNITLINAFGTDSVDVDNVSSLIIWQV